MRKYLMVALSATLTTFQCHVEHALYIATHIVIYIIYIVLCVILRYCMRMCSGDNVTKYGGGGGHPRREDRVGLQCLWGLRFFFLFRFRISQVHGRQYTHAGFMVQYTHR